MSNSELHKSINRNGTGFTLGQKRVLKATLAEAESASAAAAAAPELVADSVIIKNINASTGDFATLEEAATWVNGTVFSGAPEITLQFEADGALSVADAPVAFANGTVGKLNLLGINGSLPTLTFLNQLFFTGMDVTLSYIDFIIPEGMKLTNSNMSCISCSLIHAGGNEGGGGPYIDLAHSSLYFASSSITAYYNTPIELRLGSTLHCVSSTFVADTEDEINMFTTDLSTNTAYFRQCTFTDFYDAISPGQGGTTVILSSVSFFGTGGDTSYPINEIQYHGGYISTNTTALTLKA